MAEVVRVTREEQPDDTSTHWTTRALAERLGIGKDTVARTWRNHGLQPWKVEIFKLSKDPDFEAKLVDVPAAGHHPSLVHFRPTRTLAGTVRLGLGRLVRFGLGLLEGRSGRDGAVPDPPQAATAARQIPRYVRAAIRIALVPMGPLFEIGEDPSL